MRCCCAPGRGRSWPGARPSWLWSSAAPASPACPPPSVWPPTSPSIPPLSATGCPGCVPPAGYTDRQPVQLRRSDMDYNGHMHNTAYLSLALDAAPQQVRSGGVHQFPHLLPQPFAAGGRADALFRPQGRRLGGLLCPPERGMRRGGHQRTAGPVVSASPRTKKSCPADMCGWTGHIQGNLALRVCEAVRPSARFSAKFCPQADTRGKEFLTRDCAQKWVPPGACRTRHAKKRNPRRAPLFLFGSAAGADGLAHLP